MPATQSPAFVGASRPIEQTQPLPVTPAKVTVTDRDGRLATMEKVGVEVEVAVLGRNILALDLSSPTGMAAARVLRDALDSAIRDVAA